jgi:hypothetical protein
MAIQTINIGNIVNDGLGDDLRTAFQKVNGNFSLLAAELTVTAKNLGTTGVGIFKQKAGADLEFKSLVAGSKITITDTSDSLVIAGTQPDAFYQITTDSGVVRSEQHQFITVQGGPEITVSAIENIVTISGDIPMTPILTRFDFGFINDTYSNMVQYNTALSNSDFGTFTVPSRITVDLGEFSSPVPDLSGG